MGNQLPVNNTFHYIDSLKIQTNQKQNLKIYLWRASTHLNQYIPRVTLSLPQSTSSIQSKFTCLKTHDYLPNITFQTYLSDIKILKSSLNLQELLTFYRFLLKGHSTIFNKFHKTIINQKCSFLTHNGEIRTWINPNYFLNQFWTVQKKQFRLKSSSHHQLNCQTPRFMNRQEFQYETTTLLTVQSSVNKKLLQFIGKFSNKCIQSINFISSVQKYYDQNKLKHCTFHNTQRFINKFTYQNKLILKSNLEQAVKRLIQTKRITFPDDKITQKSKLSMFESVYIKKANTIPSKINIVIDGSQNGISVLDFKNKTNSKNHIYTGNQNFSRLLLGTSVNDDQCLQNIQKIDKSQVFQVYNPKTSIKQHRFGHKRKLSKSLIQQNNRKMIDSTQRHQDFPTVQSEALQQTDLHSIKTRPKSFYESKNINLNYSYQYSINLYTGQTKRQKQNLLQDTTHNPPSQINKESFSQYNQNSFDRLRTSNNSKTGSILKKTHKKSLQSQKQKFNIEHNSQAKLNTSKNSETQKNNQARVNFNINQNNLRFSTFGTHQKLSVSENQDLFKSFEKEQRTQKKPYNILSTRRTATKTRQNSSGNLYNLFQSQRNNKFPFHQITNYKDSTYFTSKKQSKPNPNYIQQYQLKDYGQRAQTSMLINVNYIDDNIQEEIIRSKRRISQGADSQIQKKLKALTSNNIAYGLNPSNSNTKTLKTITRLFSSQNKLQTSIGSLSQNSFSESQNNQSKYTGILTKMGRSVQYRKVQDEKLQKSLVLSKKQSKNVAEVMPNFTKKKSIYEHGSNRSMKV